MRRACAQCRPTSAYESNKSTIAPDGTSGPEVRQLPCYQSEGSARFVSIAILSLALSYLRQDEDLSMQHAAWNVIPIGAGDIRRSASGRRDRLCRIIGFDG